MLTRSVVIAALLAGALTLVFQMSRDRDAAFVTAENVRALALVFVVGLANFFVGHRIVTGLSSRRSSDSLEEATPSKRLSRLETWSWVGTNAASLVTAALVLYIAISENSQNELYSAETGFEWRYAVSLVTASYCTVLMVIGAFVLVCLVAPTRAWRLHRHGP
jgi:hypothetical protein